jgi:hypothetical protein
MWVVCVLASAARLRGQVLWLLPVSVAVLVTMCALKGTSPGGPESADRYRTWKRGQRRTPEQVEHDRRLRHDVDDEPSVTDAAARLRRFRRPGAS